MVAMGVWQKSLIRAGGLALQCMHLVFFGLLVVLPLQQAQAFDSPEHEMLGNAAVKAVMQLYQCGQPDSAHADACATLKQLDGSQPDMPRYGEVVACVDYFLTPEKLMAQYDESGSHMISAWPRKPCYDSKAMLAKLAQASHVNHTHFQKELMVSLDTYHRLALSMARDGHNLAGALFVNAIGDHYLQDFFAPGHITVRRSLITDLFANAMHDGANSLGATFHPIEGEGYERLKKVMAEIQGIAAEGQGYSTVRAEEIRSFLAGDMECLNPVEDIFGTKGIQLKGDGMLGRADGCSQRLVMLAANVLSIEDVLEAADGGKGGNYFGNYEFQYKKNLNESIMKVEYYLPEIYAQLPFGYYALGTDSRTSTANDRDLPFARDMVWTINYSKDLFYDSDKGGSRTSLLLESVPWGWVRSNSNPSLNFGLALGVQTYEADDKKPWASEKGKGLGVSVRSVVVMPETETGISAILQRTNHTGAGVDDWGNGWSIRIDQGFTSFLTFFLSWGGDNIAGAPGQLGYGHYTSAGIMFAGPAGRIKGIFKSASEAGYEQQYEFK